MKIGLLGGTFDPPHIGHLHAAKVAERTAGLDAVLFVPCARQPLKAEPPQASAFHRAAMVAVALWGRSRWLLEDVELRRGGISYTVDTLKELRKRYPGAEWHLILGADAFRSITAWKRHEEILKRCRLLVVPRPGASPYLILGAALLPKVLLCRGKALDVSSTAVRKRVSEGLPLKGIVPAEVEGYIRRQGLYGAAGGPLPGGGSRDARG